MTIDYIRPFVDRNIHIFNPASASGISFIGTSGGYQIAENGVADEQYWICEIESKCLSAAIPLKLITYDLQHHGRNGTKVKVHITREAGKFQQLPFQASGHSPRIR